jgi:hypothetical protein
MAALGDLALLASRGAADRLYEQIRSRLMVASGPAPLFWQRGWLRGHGTSLRSKPDHVPSESVRENGLSYMAKLTRAVTREELMRFVREADALASLHWHAA